jgi:glycosyltransferase involved in cell wall biosynthesis
MVIDDASPDDTAKIAESLLKEDSRVSYISHKSNKGHISTYNEGIDWVSADYMLILSADDYLLPGALARAAALMDGHPEVGMTIGRAIELQEDGSKHLSNIHFHIDEGIRWSIVTGSEFIQRSGSRNIVSTPTAVVRTQLQKKLGGYRQELPHTGDMEMWLRFAAHGSVGIVHDCQAAYRRHSSNMSIHYSEESGLPDLQQRKAALEWFFESNDYVSSHPRLCSRLLRLLSVDAISRASRAFNEGKIEISDDIAGFAVKLCPEVKRSWPWVKLACKRLVGFRAWTLLRPSNSARA